MAQRVCTEEWRVSLQKFGLPTMKLKSQVADQKVLVSPGTRRLEVSYEFYRHERSPPRSFHKMGVELREFAYCPASLVIACGYYATQK